MADKSDFMKVASAQMLRISPKQERQNNAFDQQKHKKQTDDSDKDHFTESSDSEGKLLQLNSNQMIELGRLILNKRNTEMKLYLRLLKKHREKDSGFYQQIDADILIIKSKLAEIDKTISDLDFFVQSGPEVEAEEDDVLEKLGQLKRLYDNFLETAREENESVLKREFDNLDILISEKETILRNIEAFQKTINYNLFKKYPPENAKKVKANAYLSDIHNVMNEIVRVEDENSVELQQTLQEMKLEIQSRNVETKAISKYSTGNIKSHFIDTTK